MIDLKEFIETEKINKSALSDSLGITRTTLYTWLEDKKPEKIEKIIKAINQLAEDLTTKIKDAGMQIGTVNQSHGGVQIAGVGGGNINIDSVKENENLKMKVTLLEQKETLLEAMIKSKEDQISLLKELLNKERGN